MFTKCSSKNKEVVYTEEKHIKMEENIAVTLRKFGLYDDTHTRAPVK